MDVTTQSISLIKTYWTYLERVIHWHLNEIINKKMNVVSLNNLLKKFTYNLQGLSQAKKTVKGTICPLQNLGKKLERKHTRRVLSRYRNCKLKQNVESIFSCTFKVHSKVTFQSHFTEKKFFFFTEKNYIGCL